MNNEVDDRKRRAQELFKTYFLRPVFDSYFADIEKITKRLPTEYKQIAESFKHNITATMLTVSVPSAIAMSIISNYRVHDLFKRYGLDQILEGKITDAKSITTDQKSEWYKLARKQHEEEMAEQGEAFHKLTDNINDFLLSILKDNHFEIAAKELILQGVVLTWGAFEVLCRDLFVTYMNLNSDRALTLMMSDYTKKYYDKKYIDIELMHNYGYDISDSMGEVLCEMHDISGIASIRNVFRSLFPNNGGLIEKLMSPDLWLLSQERHLIVHQMGVVDKKFVDNTGVNLPIGEILNVAPDKLDAFLNLVRDTGSELFGAVYVEQNDA